ncbi:MAG: hypothetical protein KJ077_08365 [Anaerolineae bacterium]|nr:hypothetical protein [Anaerolineae bacterium]
MALLLQSPIDEARKYAAMDAWLKAHTGHHIDPATGETDIAALVEDWALNSGQAADPDAVLRNPYHPAWSAAKDARIAAEFAAARAAFAALVEREIQIVAN